jgi:hypothetical protein
MSPTYTFISVRVVALVEIAENLIRVVVGTHAPWWTMSVLVREAEWLAGRRDKWPWRNA